MSRARAREVEPPTASQAVWHRSQSANSCCAELCCVVVSGGASSTSSCGLSRPYVFSVSSRIEEKKEIKVQEEEVEDERDCEECQVEIEEREQTFTQAHDAWMR